MPRASNKLTETGFRHAVIKRQLSHGGSDNIRAQYLKERRQLMAWWGTYLESQEAGANVIPRKRPA